MKNTTLTTNETTTHTPGPWNIGDDSPNDYEGPVIDTRDRVIAVITIDDETESTPEDRANARLIAAAPDIISRLIDSADAIDAVICNIQGGARDALREINRQNRAAIAKATGQE